LETKRTDRAGMKRRKRRAAGTGLSGRQGARRDPLQAAYAERSQPIHDRPDIRPFAPRRKRALNVSWRHLRESHAQVLLKDNEN